MSGGEPLSEERINALWDVLWERAVRDQNEEARADLRAFAREILTSAREVAPERPNSLQPFDESAARSLLASQSREKALSEKLTSLESVDKQLTDAREALETERKESKALRKACEVALGSVVGHDSVKRGGDFPACGIEFPITRDVLKLALVGAEAFAEEEG